MSFANYTKVRVKLAVGNRDNRKEAVKEGRKNEKVAIIFVDK